VLVLAACAPNPRGCVSRPHGEPPPNRSPSATLILSSPPPRFRLAAPWELDTGIDQATTYIDLSASMRGYARGPSSPLFRMLQRVKEVLVGRGVRTFEAAGFGRDVQDRQTVGGLVDALAWPPDQTATCPATALSQAAGADVAESSLVVVVTDGVASGSGSDCGPHCAAGSDVACVGQALADLALNGRALWLFGVQIPFSGRYYSEISRQPLELHGEGRPIYLWISGRNLQLGRDLLDALTRWAQENQLGQVLAAEAWPGRWVGLVPRAQPRWRLQDVELGGRMEARGSAIVMTGQISRVDGTAFPRIIVPSGELSKRFTIRIPLASVDAFPATIAPFIVVTSQFVVREPENPQASPGEVPRCDIDLFPSIPGGRVQAACLRPGSGKANERSLEVALEPGTDHAANGPVLSSTWRIGEGAAALLAPWTTTDDSTLKAVHQTLGLAPLWEIVTTRIRTQEPHGLQKPIAEFREDRQ
jgi:hypothetical protein